MRRLALALATASAATACHHDKGASTSNVGSNDFSGPFEPTVIKDTGPPLSVVNGSAEGDSHGEDSTAGGGDTGPQGGGDQGSGAGSDQGSGAGSGSGSGSSIDTSQISDTSHLGQTEGPSVSPPNTDPDPSQVGAQVQQHIKKGNDALSGSPPDADTAIAEAKSALAVDGTSVDAVVLLAHAYYDKKLYDTAETILDMAYKDKTRSDVVQSNPGIWYVYGLVYDKESKPEAAFKAFQKAVDLKPDYGSALVDLGMHQLSNKQYAAAVETYEKLTNQLSYNDAITWNSLGAAYRGRSADYDAGSGPRQDYVLKAQTAFQHATQADGNYGPTYYNLCLLYLDADPFPDGSGGSLDTLVRLQKSQTYLDEYQKRPGFDQKLYDERSKNLQKLIKRAQKKAKSSSGGNP